MSEHIPASPPSQTFGPAESLAPLPGASVPAQAPNRPIRPALRVIWFAAGVLALALGLLGVVLPLLPTTPFLLLAAACFARSSQRMHDWLLAHKRFGPAIQNWRDHRAISPRAKKMALIAMAATFLLSLVLGLPIYALMLQGVALLAAGSFIATRADGPQAPAAPLPREEQP